MLTLSESQATDRPKLLQSNRIRIEEFVRVFEAADGPALLFMKTKSKTAPEETRVSPLLLSWFVNQSLFTTIFLFSCFSFARIPPWTALRIPGAMSLFIHFKLILQANR